MKQIITLLFLIGLHSFSLAQQSASKVLMVKPANFGYNNETASSNAFQQNISISNDSLQSLALQEFHHVVKTLQAKGIETIILEDSKTPIKPDAIFPNNWVSFHSDGRVILYPMAAPNRRLERRQDFIPNLYKQYTVKEVIDWSIYETDNQFLEGTGSIVFDHNNQIAFACASPRTNGELLTRLSEKLEYKPVLFHAIDEKKTPIYHTNVMMSIGSEFAVVCLESIADENEKTSIIDYLKNGNKEIIDISLAQMKNFAGNILELKGTQTKPLIVLSQRAFNAFSSQQKEQLTKFGELVVVSIPTIETVGGGGVRCMLTEMFLKK